MEMVKAKSEVIGVTVKNLSKETLGKIEDIALDKSTGKPLYLAIECGGFLGLGSKLFALPWNAISYSKEDGCFLSNIDKKLLERAKGFDKNHWPETADTTFGVFKMTEKTY